MIMINFLFIKLKFWQFPEEDIGLLEEIYLVENMLQAISNH